MNSSKTKIGILGGGPLETKNKNVIFEKLLK